MWFRLFAITLSLLEFILFHIYICITKNLVFPFIMYLFLPKDSLKNENNPTLKVF
jgi:hypothetical protein